MNNIKKTVGINLIVLVVFALLITLPFLTSNPEEEGYSHNSLEYVIGYAFLIAIQSVINLLISLYFFIIKNNEMGKAFLLSFILVLVIGFSSCMAIFNR